MPAGRDRTAGDEPDRAGNGGNEEPGLRQGAEQRDVAEQQARAGLPPVQAPVLPVKLQRIE
jgi:hypothetical protein